MNGGISGDKSLVTSFTALEQFTGASNSLRAPIWVKLQTDRTNNSYYLPLTAKLHHTIPCCLLSLGVRTFHTGCLL